MSIRYSHLIALAAAMLLSACAGPSASMRRNLDVEGTLPELIGAGAFAPSCLLFCFVISNTTKHGNAPSHADQDGVSIRKTEREDLHQRRSTKP